MALILSTLIIAFHTKISIITLNTYFRGSVIFGLQNTFKIGALVLHTSFLILSTHGVCFSNKTEGVVWM